MKNIAIASLMLVSVAFAQFDVRVESVGVFGSSVNVKGRVENNSGKECKDLFINFLIKRRSGQTVGDAIAHLRYVANRERRDFVAIGTVNTDVTNLEAQLREVKCY